MKKYDIQKIEEIDSFQNTITKGKLDIYITKIDGTYSWWNPEHKTNIKERVIKGEELIKRHVNIPKTILKFDNTLIRPKIIEQCIDNETYVIELAKTISIIHSIPLPKNTDFIGDARINTQIKVLDKYFNIDKLKKNIPKERENVLLHGDCHEGNFIFNKTIYVLDLEELAYGPREVDIAEIIESPLLKKHKKLFIKSYEHYSGFKLCNLDFFCQLQNYRFKLFSKLK